MSPCPVGAYQSPCEKCFSLSHDDYDYLDRGIKRPVHILVGLEADSVRHAKKILNVPTGPLQLGS